MKTTEYAIEGGGQSLLPPHDRLWASDYELKNPSTGGVLSYTNPQAAETYTKRARKEQG
jgi:hypothetical protein